MNHQPLLGCTRCGSLVHEFEADSMHVMQFDRALEFYELAIKAQPSHAEAHCNRGVILKNKGCLDEAIQAYSKALEAAPDFQIVQTNLAIALTEKATLIKQEGRLDEGHLQLQV